MAKSLLIRLSDVLFTYVMMLVMHASDIASSVARSDDFKLTTRIPVLKLLLCGRLSHYKTVIFYSENITIYI